MSSPIPVLFRDNRVAILDKPAGMPVHPVRDGSVSIEDHFHELGRFRAGPWLAHRLDRDTSGCLVVALKRTALHALGACFAEGRAVKTYWAITDGVPAARSGVIRNRLARIQRGRAWRMEAGDDGDEAETAWQVLGSAGPHAWLELRPRTGRTHQLRSHCASLGCPVLGDPIYGIAASRGDGGVPLQPCLHARAIALPLEPPIGATAPPPPHMRPWLATNGFDGHDASSL